MTWCLGPFVVLSTFTVGAIDLTNRLVDVVKVSRDLVTNHGGIDPIPTMFEGGETVWSTQIWFEQAPIPFIYNHVY